MKNSFKYFIIYPLVIVLAVTVVPLFFSINVPKLVKSELEAMLKEYILPNNPRYTEYENKEWNFSFNYPTHMQLAAGPSENNTRFAVFVYSPGYKQVRQINNLTGEEELMGVHILKNRTFDTEVQRVGGERKDLVQRFDIKGRRAIRISEHLNRVNDLQEEALVVDDGTRVISFFISRKEDNKELRSFYDHMIDSFDFEL